MPRQPKPEAEQQIAILDMETDPFDAEGNKSIHPFCAVLYTGPENEPITFWDADDHTSLLKNVFGHLETLPGSFTIYAHNGGRFDYLYFLHRLRGRCNFKGRGVMSAKIGGHELRDSFHIVPQSLRSYQKDDFDYSWCRRENRSGKKEAIIRYCVNDCKYTYEIVKGFISSYGKKLSIGQAAITELKKVYKYEKLPQSSDSYIRPFFFGGRVQCIRGNGHWKKPLKLYDVNSMYPDAMAHYSHPTGRDFRVRTDGRIRPSTCFIELSCNSQGAFLLRNAEGGVDVPHGRHRFHTTIHEYNTASRLGLINREVIHRTLDFETRSDFRSFIVPKYDRRETLKRKLDICKGECRCSYCAALKSQYHDLFLESTLIKLLLNNSYGKFAQNPENFFETFLTDPDIDYPPGETLPTKEQVETARASGKQTYWGIYNPIRYSSKFGPTETYSDYWLWKRPAQRTAGLYNNVATGASITGAARAKLLEALFLAKNPYYCDTDSIICEDLPGVDLDAARLGAWDLEAEFDELVIAGKKTYAFKKSGETKKVRSKGVSGLTFEDIQSMVEGTSITRFASKAPLIGRDGSQTYIKRSLKTTTPKMERHNEFLALRAA